MSNIPNINNLKALKGKILVKQLKTQDQTFDGIIIPAKKSCFNKLAEILDIGYFQDNKYLDGNTGTYRKIIFKKGDIVNLNFASVDYTEAIDDKGTIYRVMSILPEIILNIVK